MNVIILNKKISIISLSPEEEFIESLTRYCKENKISAGYLTAIGACKKLKLAWYNLETKSYEDHEYSEDMEISGIIGNIALIDGKPFIHAHGTFAKRDLTVIGGHIRSMIISAACEVRLEVFEGKIERKHDEFTGLKLMSCNA